MDYGKYAQLVEAVDDVGNLVIDGRLIAKELKIARVYEQEFHQLPDDEALVTGHIDVRSLCGASVPTAGRVLWEKKAVDLGKQILGGKWFPGEQIWLYLATNPENPIYFGITTLFADLAFTVMDGNHRVFGIQKLQNEAYFVEFRLIKTLPVDSRPLQSSKINIIKHQHVTVSFYQLFLCIAGRLQIEDDGVLRNSGGSRNDMISRISLQYQRNETHLRRLVNAVVTLAGYVCGSSDNMYEGGKYGSPAVLLSMFRIFRFQSISLDNDIFKEAFITVRKTCCPPRPFSFVSQWNKGAMQVLATYPACSFVSQDSVFLDKTASIKLAGFNAIYEAVQQEGNEFCKRMKKDLFLRFFAPSASVSPAAGSAVECVPHTALAQVPPPHPPPHPWLFPPVANNAAITYTFICNVKG
jgi:hypothetical protein